jgi:hypothetical protein
MKSPADLAPALSSDEVVAPNPFDQFDSPPTPLETALIVLGSPPEMARSLIMAAALRHADAALAGINPTGVVH